MSSGAHQFVVLRGVRSIFVQLELVVPKRVLLLRWPPVSQLVGPMGVVEVGTADRRLLVDFSLLVEFIQVQLIKPPGFEIEFFSGNLLVSLVSVAIVSGNIQNFVRLLAANFNIFASEKLDLVSEIA